MEIVFKTSQYGFHAELNDTAQAKEIIKNIPFESTIQRCDGEIYFEANIFTISTGATLDVNLGDVAYWPQGRCLCIFFGPTQASTTEKPVPQDPVAIVGKTYASQDELKQIQPGEKIKVEAVRPKEDKQKQDTRILSQSEIDNIVQELLIQKRSSNS